jgi:hypothetical protein
VRSGRDIWLQSKEGRHLLRFKQLNSAQRHLSVGLMIASLLIAGLAAAPSARADDGLPRDWAILGGGPFVGRGDLGYQPGPPHFVGELGCLFRTVQIIIAPPVHWKAGDPAWTYVYTGPGTVRAESNTPVPKSADGSATVSSANFAGWPLDDIGIEISATIGEAAGTLDLYVGGTKEDSVTLSNDNLYESKKTGAPICMNVVGAHFRLVKKPTSRHRGKLLFIAHSDTGASLAGLRVRLDLSGKQPRAKSHRGKRQVTTRNRWFKVTGTTTKIRLPKLHRGDWRATTWITSMVRGEVNSKIESGGYASLRFRVQH